MLLYEYLYSILYWTEFVHSSTLGEPIGQRWMYSWDSVFTTALLFLTAKATDRNALKCSAVLMDDYILFCVV